MNLEMRPREEIEDNNQTDASVGGASHTQQRTLLLEVLLDIRDLLRVLVQRVTSLA